VRAAVRGGAARGALLCGALLCGALLCGALLCGAPLPAAAAPAAAPQIRPGALVGKKALDARHERLTRDLPKRELTAVLDGLAGLLARDLAARPTHAVSPLAVRGVEARAPLAPELADWLELRIEALVHQSSGHQLARCVPCRAQRTSLDEGGWVFRQGLSAPRELAAAARASGARALLDLSVGWSVELNRVHLRARLLDGVTGEETWAQDYHSDADAAPARARAPGAAATQELTSEGRYEARAEALRVQRFDGHFGGGVGWGLHPTEGPAASVSAPELHAAYSERFGEGERLRYAGRLELAVSTGGTHVGVKLGGELLWLSSQSAPRPGASPHAGLWLGGGGALAYVFARQGVDLHVAAEWVSGLGLGARLSAGYVLGFGEAPDEPRVIGGVTATLAAVFYL